MAVSYILMALIPFIVFAAVVGNMFISSARATTMNYTAQLVGQVSNAIDIYINGIEETADYIVLQTRNLISRDGLEAAKAQISGELESIAATRLEVAGILVAFDDDGYISTGMSRISRDPFVLEDWYTEAASLQGGLAMLPNTTGRNTVTNKDYSVDDVFSLAKAITDDDGKTIGVVLMDVRHELIRESISSVSIGERGFVFVLDAGDNVVYAPVNNVVFRVHPQWLKDSRPVTVGINGSIYHIRSESSSYTGWKSVGVFSFDEVMSDVNNIYYVLLVFIVVIVALTIFISVMIADSVTKPINKLRELMFSAESGDLSVRFNRRYNDEIGDLAASFNDMLNRINQLIAKVYEEQKSKREAELKSLQAQIKPHFLYNTLDTIAWMARSRNVDDIVALVDAMTNMFRVGFSHGTDFITLQDEIKHVSNYLYIQGIRYKDKLSWVIDIDKSLFDCRVPKLILQPLAENAIYHGIKLKRGVGKIWIAGGLDDGGGLWLSVKDDGAGMDEQRLERLNLILREAAGDAEGTEWDGADNNRSFGVFYIQRRLTLSFGNGYGLTLSSVKNQGTTAIVTMPTGRAVPDAEAD
jgi:two-component system sensor histidine kinase YesM